MKRLTRLAIVLGALIVSGYTLSTYPAPTHAQTGDTYTVFLPLVSAEPLRVLWADQCDPRTDPHICYLSDSLTILDEFYATLNEVGATIQYAQPQSLDQLRQYDVVIAN